MNKGGKHIAKNTVILYLRMMVTMLVTLYTSRIILESLGIEDYGIYNVVGGVVTLFSFINGAMTSATQRYITFAIGKGDAIGLPKVFCISLLSHISIIAIVLFFSETIGLWFLNSYISIPNGKIVEANLVYQFSILAFCFQIIKVPYDANIIAQEKMSIYAYVSIAEVIMKLCIAFLLQLFFSDRLVLYAFLIFFSSVLFFFLNKFFCLKMYPYCKYHFYWDKDIYKELMSFSGWIFLGQVAIVFSSQGNNILLNMFYGVVVNAALGISNQVNSALMSFVSNFQTAFKPQITKSYANNDFEYLFNMMFYTSKMSFYLIYLLAIPIIFNIDAILNCWLTVVPTYTANFCILMIIYSLLDAVTGPFWMAIFATGKIKKYQIILSVFIFSSIILSYFSLYFGGSPESVLWIRVGINVLVLLIRVYFVKYLLGVPLELFLHKVLLPVGYVVILSIPLSYLVYMQIYNFHFIFILVVILLLNGVIVMFAGINKNERRQICNMVYNLKLKRV